MNNSPRSNRPRRSARIRAKWQQHITAQQVSGLTQAAYCREHGVDAKYFSLWKSKLAKPEAIAPSATPQLAKPELIPVIVKPEVVPATEPAKSTPPISACAVPSNNCVLKATLPNGIALEFLFLPTQSLTPLLSVQAVGERPLQVAA